MSTKIIDKVKKLLALATSDNPNEAAAALDRAQQLMAEHGIGAEQLEASTTEERIVEGKVRSIATASRAKDWEQYLLNRVGVAFGCELMFIRGLKYASGKDQYAHWILVGAPLDVEVAVYAGAALLKQLSRARAKFTRQLPDVGRWYKTREVDTYCLGWVHSAVAKLQPMMDARVRAARAERGETFALVVLSKEEQAKARRDAYVEEKATGKVKTNQSEVGSRDSFERGVADGREAQVHSAMKDGATKAPALGDGL